MSDGQGSEVELNVPSSVASPLIVSAGSRAGDDVEEPLTSKVPVPSVSEVALESESAVVVTSPLSVVAPIRVSVVSVAVDDVERSSSAFSSVKVEPNVAAPWTLVVPPSRAAPLANVAVPESEIDPVSCTRPVRFSDPV